MFMCSIVQYSAFFSDFNKSTFFDIFPQNTRISAVVGAQLFHVNGQMVMAKVTVIFNTLVKVRLEM